MKRFGSVYRRVRWRVRRRPRLVALVAIVIIAGLVAYFLRPGPDLRAGSVELPPGSLEVGARRPSSYRVVYRIESRAGGETVVSTERMWVRRPFESRVESWTGEPPGRRRTNVTIGNFARLKVGNGVFATPPAPAPQDYRPGAVLEEAGAEGYVDARERRRVADRVCRVYRHAGDAGSAMLTRLAEAEDYSETCFDAAGIALEEVSTIDGKPLLRRVAVEVEEEPDIPRRFFRTGDPELSVRQGGGSVREVDKTSRNEGTFWELAGSPEGFEHTGRYASIPPQTGFDDPTQRSGIIAFTSDVFRGGIDTFVIEQGATLGGAAPFQEDPDARRVRAGDLGRAELLYGLRSSEVRVLRKGGRFIRVIGTISPSRLLAVARSLEEKEGGTLRYL